MLTIDGSYGEGGGQIVRTALTLSCITSTPIEIQNIRAGRKKPGLRPQHLACVQAAAEVCAAEVVGDDVGSSELMFWPGRPAHAGNYFWKIPTAGSAVLVMQTVLLPLAMARGESRVSVIGGTHVPFSPPGHYLRDVYVPMLIQSGVEAFASVDIPGWYPKGGGQITAHLEGWSQLHGQDLTERGELERIFGVGLVSKLPAHIPQRMADYANRVLAHLDVPVDVRPERDGASRGAGAGFFLTAEYSNGRAGFSMLGERGVASETLVDEVSYELQVFHADNASVDSHLADQLVLVLALANGNSRFITPQVTEHLRTNVWVIQQFIERPIRVDEHTGLVEIEG